MINEIERVQKLYNIKNINEPSIVTYTKYIEDIKRVYRNGYKQDFKDATEGEPNMIELFEKFENNSN